jgi:hypothetical protein
VPELRGDEYRANLAIQPEPARLGATDILTMFTIENPILWIVGVPSLGVLLFLLRGHFSGDTRARRRRGQSHMPMTSQKPGPTVLSAVDVNKPKRDRKR